MWGWDGGCAVAGLQASHMQGKCPPTKLHPWLTLGNSRRPTAGQEAGSVARSACLAYTWWRVQTMVSPLVLRRSWQTHPEYWGILGENRWEQNAMPVFTLQKKSILTVNQMISHRKPLFYLSSFLYHIDIQINHHKFSDFTEIYSVWGVYACVSTKGRICVLAFVSFSRPTYI